MKSLLLTFCITLSLGALYAQISSLPPQLPKQSYGFKGNILKLPISDTSVILTYPANIWDGTNASKPNIDNMPVAGEGRVVLTLQGNNGKGFNLYSATPENMPVLKPDSTSYYTMPNAFRPIKTIGKH